MYAKKSKFKLKSFSHSKFHLQEFLLACEGDTTDDDLDLSKYAGIYEIVLRR